VAPPSLGDSWNTRHSPASRMPSSRTWRRKEATLSCYGISCYCILGSMLLYRSGLACPHCPPAGSASAFTFTSLAIWQSQSMIMRVRRQMQCRGIRGNTRHCHVSHVAHERCAWCTDSGFNRRGMRAAGQLLSLSAKGARQSYS